MEIIFSFFSAICSLIVDIIYENVITNNLFTFDIQKKKKFILIKKGKNAVYKIIKEKKI